MLAHLVLCMPLNEAGPDGEVAWGPVVPIDYLHCCVGEGAF